MTTRTATKLWATWAVAGVTLEAVTYFKGDDGATLSAHVWDTGRIPRRTPFSLKFRQSMAAGFLAWVVVHFVSGGKV